ncbi:MAG: hypothetical protein ACLQPN_17620 [Bryobacteraceae bacterium]
MRTQITKRHTSALWMAALGLALIGFSANAQFGKAADQITVFDAPGAAYGTVGYGINPEGAITGYYVDLNGAYHGYLRDHDGRFTSFEPPNAAGTIPWSINPNGEITGQYWYADGTNHGFLRDPKGGFTTFDAPGAGTGTNQGTMGEAISPSGWIGGDLLSGIVWHTFVRAPHGAITEFTVPGANYGPGGSVWVCGICGINPAGTVVGAYTDSSSTVHGYVRDPQGTISQIDVTGAGTGSHQGTYYLEGTYPECMNPAGAIAGNYIDTNGTNHGFLRAPDGTITTFDFPGAATGPGQGTIGWDVDPGGTIVGSYYDVNSASHGFVRSPDGKFTAFDCPGAGTGPWQGTFPASNSETGAITGVCVDGAYVSHGFVRNQ